MTRLFSLCIAALFMSVLSGIANAQWDPAGSSYANLYTWQLGTSGQPLNKNTYLWDRYYYNNPNVSPYLNLTRVQPYGGTDYFTYVQPQEKLRQQQASLSAGGPTAGGHFDAGPGSLGGSGSMVRPKNPFSRGPGGAADSEIMPYNTNSPNRSSSYYYNHYYGGWQGRN
jgi:hypothetical protein